VITVGATNAGAPASTATTSASYLVAAPLNVTVSTDKATYSRGQTATITATVKSGLVVLFFMHLKDEPWIVRVMLVIAIAALALIMLLTFSDVLFREGADAAS
jgi:caa(3)-type oxidase subunit IV